MKSIIITLFVFICGELEHIQIIFELCDFMSIIKFSKFILHFLFLHSRSLKNRISGYSLQKVFSKLINNFFKENNFYIKCFYSLWMFLDRESVEHCIQVFHACN